MLSSCRVIDLRKISDPRGNLTPIESDSDLPFAVQRIYYLYDVPSGSSRGGHAHRQLHQLIVAVSGSFDVVLDDGFERKSITLNFPNRGLLIVPYIWRELENFSSGSVCVVLASAKYDESDYIRDYETFLNYVR